MDKKPGIRLGDLQLRIMRVLWDSDAATVSEVQRQLGRPPLAYTTVAHDVAQTRGAGAGRPFRGRPQVPLPRAVSMPEVTRSMTGDLVDRLFDGSLTDAVSHLLDSRGVSADELDRLERMIQQRKSKP